MINWYKIIIWNKICVALYYESNNRNGRIIFVLVMWLGFLNCMQYVSFYFSFTLHVTPSSTPRPLSIRTFLSIICANHWFSRFDTHYNDICSEMQLCNYPLLLILLINFGLITLQRNKNIKIKLCDFIFRFLDILPTI